MASIAINALAARYAQSGDYLQNLLNDSRYTQAQVAFIMGTTPQAFANALAEVNAAQALHRKPHNWVSGEGVAVGTVNPYSGPFSGQVAQVYTGPAEPGFTWGLPVYDADTPHPILSQKD